MSPIVEENILPWMSEKEIKVIEHVLMQIQPEYCLEWGSGNSTFYFSKYARRSWISVEHDRTWFERGVQRLQEEPKVWLLFRERPDTYVFGGGQPFHSESGFDFILIDGWKRPMCLLWATIILKPEGVVCMHDYKQEGFFDEDIAACFQYQKKFPDQDGIWVGSKNRDLEVLFNGLTL